MMTITSPQLSGDRLALLYRLAQTFSSSLDLDEVLNRVMDEVIAVTHAERGFVMLRGPEGNLVFCAARGIDQTTIAEPHFQVSRSVVERVAHEGEPVLTSDAQRDDRFSMRQSVTLLGLRSILCVPLKIKDQVSGVVYVDNRVQAGIFSQADLELLSAIASSAAIALENARLYQVAIEKGRLEQELHMAREVQAGLLPRETPQIPGWTFNARWTPAREVAGDYYDFIQRAEGRLGLVIADVSDKGMPAALFMALTRSIVRASVDGALSPAEGITRANRLIYADATGGMFVTLFYALLDPVTGELSYVNAGHNPPLLYRAAAHELLNLRGTGMALGVDANAAFEQRTVYLHPGDFLLLYTDGVTDTLNAQEPETSQMFGIERLRRVALDAGPMPALEIVRALEQAISAFTASTAPFDDIAIVVAKRGEISG